MKCKHRDCELDVMEEPIKDISCDWFRYHKDVSEVCMYRTRPMKHELCTHHYYEKLEVGMES